MNVLLKFSTGLVILMFFQVSVVFSESDKQSDFTFGLGAFSGHSTYTTSGNIKYSGSSGETDLNSEATYPLDVNLILIGFDYRINSSLLIKSSIASNTSRGVGEATEKMYGVDSDDADTLSSESNSTTEIKADLIDFSIQRFWRPTDKLRIYAGGSYLYESFDFKLSDTEKKTSTVTLSGGDTGEYEIQYLAFSALVGVEYQFELVKVYLDINSSLVANADDKRVFAENNDEYHNEFSGTIQSVNLHFLFTISNRSAIELRHHQRKVSMSGTQSHKVDKETYKEMDSKLSSDQGFSILAYHWYF